METATPTQEVMVGDATKTHIRGSSLLLFGRILAMGMNFAGQVLIVRYLSKQNYGAFAYAISVIELTAAIALIGLDKSIVRFLPIYHENKEYQKMFGTLVMTIGSVLGIGLAIVFLVFGFQGLLSGSLINDPLAVSLLLILIVLAPLGALDQVFEGIIIVFVKPSAIFFRRHILGPGLKLAAVLLVMLFHSNVYVLAILYLTAGGIGFLVYVLLLYQVLKQQNLLAHFKLHSMQLPAREIYGFSFPLLTTDVVMMLKNSMVVILLERFASTTNVAEYRAVVPVAGLILVVFQSFKYLYTPLAARLFARHDQSGINQLYWRTAIWIAVISFPLFVVTFSFAKPITVLLFGSRYAQSWIVLAFLSLGNYFNAALGFNSYTLRVYGKVRYIVIIDLLTLILGLVFYLLLIPTYGSTGAAIATCLTLIVYNLLNHAGLLMGTGVELFQWRYLRTYVSILVGAGVLLLFEEMFETHLLVNLILVGLTSLAVIRFNLKVLEVDHMFPEIRRIPLVKPLLGL